MAQLLIHGTLYATIYEAHSLRNPTAGLRKSRLYATIDLERVRVGRTRVIEDEPVNPRWNESFRIYCAHQAANVVVSVKDDKPVRASRLGCAYVPVIDLLDEEKVDRCHKLLNHKDRKPVGGWIRVKLQYFDIPCYPQLSHSPEFPNVPHTFNPQHKGCKVTLYQDAHMPNKFMPRIPLAGGRVFQQHCCWEDVFDAIENARHLIYIAGWSVYTQITLIRDSQRPKRGGDQTLGELLKKKAEEGVRVLMLLWKDRTSIRLCKKDGLMATHGRETFKYFKGTKVHCVLCPRNPKDGSSCVQHLLISTMFTHHQKIVVTDAPLPGCESLISTMFTHHQKRQIVSFVGGIDLCDGRYDTQLHSLFLTLDSTHLKDFRQPNFRRASINEGGPRQPWHDIHCKLEGSIALDVLLHFEQRWRKQGDKNVLFPQENFVIPVLNDEDPETWHVQLLRSIDGEAAYGFSETPKEAARAGLVSGKGRIIDRSIQDAYIHAIRRAKDFIYIESQYFLGSSYGWKPDDGIKALHLIPKELSLKIVSKIKAGEAIRVYVVLPMWPEGVPRSAVVQAILDWQRRTMEMMYTDIAQALRRNGIHDGNTRDYLTFFCLGNREVKRGDEYMPKLKLKWKSKLKLMWKWNRHYKRAQKNRRFMIYVHSKMMIVDDEYIIVGSANINQRSMDGARDTEIAMGAYQPYHLAAQEPARGQIYGFRMSLWYEHTGMLDHDLFSQPQSIECIQKMNEMGESNWNLYSSDALEHDLPGHLLRYPVRVTNDGDVTELPGFKYFPDTKARVLGSKKYCPPPILTV